MMMGPKTTLHKNEKLFTIPSILFRYSYFIYGYGTGLSLELEGKRKDKKIKKVYRKDGGK